MVLHLEISLALLLRELILEKSLHCRLKNAFWDPNSWNIMVVRPQNSTAGVWVNSEGITQWINYWFSSKAVYYCYSHISIGSILTPEAVFTFMSRFVCSKIKVLLSLGCRNLSLVPYILFFCCSWTSARGATLQALLFAISLKFSVSFCKEKTVELSSILDFQIINSILSQSEEPLTTASLFVSHKTHWLSQRE